jgi:hypothetical protein
VPDVVTPADARAHLGLGDDTSHDDELAGFIDAAVEAVEQVVGPILPRTVTERHHGGIGVLRQAPVLAVTAVASSNGDAVLPTAYYVDTATGEFALSTYRDVLIEPFRDGRDYVTVTYTAGRDTVPPGVRMAVLELVRLHYTAGQQGYRPNYGEPELATDDVVINGYLLSRKVLGWLAPYRVASGGFGG